MTKLRQDAEKTPISHLIIVTLIAVGGVAIPLHYLTDLLIADKGTSELVAKIAIRLILLAVAMVFIFKYGYHRAFIGKCGILSVLAVIPALCVAINNFPIVGLITGGVTVVASPLNLALYILLCLVVGVYEEVVFRGIVLPLMLKATEKLKHGVFWAVAFSSMIFGASHLIGLLNGGNVGAVFLQVGYSFLIGAMCGISLLITRNLFTAIVLHFVYDVGGLMLAYPYIAVGFQWDTLTIILTAVLGVIVFIYMLVMLLRIDYKRVKPLYYPDGLEENDAQG